MNQDINSKLARYEKLAEEGRLDEALHGLWKIIELQPANERALSSVAKVLLLGGMHAERQNDVTEAYSLYSRAISFDGDLLPARKRLLLLIPRFLDSMIRDGAGALDRNKDCEGTLILGIGSGRSGSTSLTRLFSMQPGTYMTHEHPPKLPWVASRNRYAFHVRRFRKLLHAIRYAGDVSHWWLPYIGNILNDFPAVRIVAMERNKKETIESFESVLGPDGSGQNHWIDHQGNGWQPSPWDSCFPKYSVESRHEALGFYWDEYYAKVHELSEKYPGHIMVFDIDDLNSSQGQAKILRFCGYDKPVTVSSSMMFNKGTTTDGSTHY